MLDRHPYIIYYLFLTNIYLKTFQYPALGIYLRKSRYDWNYTTRFDGYAAQGARQKVVELSRGRVLGGSSALNDMLYVRGAPENFDSWASIVEDPRWNYNNVLPFFIKSEKLRDRTIEKSCFKEFHGTKGYMGVSRQPDPANKVYLDMYKELGNRLILDINGRDYTGYTQPMYTALHGRRQDAAYAFLSPAKNRENLHVITDTLVTEIIFEGNKAVGVRALTNQNKLITLKAKEEVILSAGAFNSAQLLMLSGIGPRKHLEKMNIAVRADLPVGENLQDHAETALFYDMVKEDPLPTVIDPGKAPDRIIMGYVPMNKSQCNNADYQSVSLMRLNMNSILQQCVLVFTLNDTICTSVFRNVKGKSFLFVSIKDLNPKSRGRVLLRSRNPQDSPIVIGNYYAKDIDLQNQVKYVKDFNRITESTYFKKVGGRILLPRLPKCDRLKLFSNAYWQFYVLAMMGTGYHYSGTCALGSVVDAELRVRGFRQLRVADASIMPTLPTSNTNAPSIMIGEKAAYFIKEAFKSSSKYNRKCYKCC